jgi:hypothetical protein
MGICRNRHQHGNPLDAVLLIMEPDPRQTRLAELKRQLFDLTERIRPYPVGSPDRDALADRLGELAGAAISLSEELHG